MSTVQFPEVRVRTFARGAPEQIAAPFAAAFVAGETERGFGPARVTSILDFERRFGGRLHNSMMYDWLETFFQEGGAEAWVTRVVGDNTAAAEVELEESGGGDNVVKVSAESVGVWGNDLRVVIADDGTNFKVTVELDEEPVEIFRRLTDVFDAEERIDSRFIVWETLTDAEAGDKPENGTFDLTGGANGDAAGDSDVEEAFDRFERDFGAGIVAAPGRTTSTTHDMLMDHATEYNRRAILDAPIGESKANVITAAQRFTLTFDDGTRVGMMPSSWVNIPPLAPPGSLRAVPGSALVAGKIALSQAETGTPNTAAAGARSEAAFVVSVVDPFGVNDGRELAEEHVNWIRDDRRLGVRVYGFRSLTFDENWTQFSWSLLEMALLDRFEAVGEEMIFKVITGAGLTRAEFRERLLPILQAEFDANGLFGESAEDAFSVDVSEDVNPPEDLAAGILRARVEARMSPYAERVVIDLVKVAPNADVS